MSYFNRLNAPRLVTVELKRFCSETKKAITVAAVSKAGVYYNAVLADADFVVVYYQTLFKLKSVVISKENMGQYLDGEDFSLERMLVNE